MEVFIAKIVGEVTESISVSGVEDIKDVLDLYKEMSVNAVYKPTVTQHTEVVLDDGSVAVCGMTLGEGGYNSEILEGKAVNLTEVEISPWYNLDEIKAGRKSEFGDKTYCLSATPTLGKGFDLTIEDIKLLHKEFGEIIKFWEE